MPEEHLIVGVARGEPLPAGRVGVCLRFPLSGSPSPRWSRDLSARLTGELTGHTAIGHLRLNHLVQGSEIVLEGVEAPEASSIAGAIERAVDGANHDCAHETDADRDKNAPQAYADDLARDVGATQQQLS
ncbi:MAG: hypothetical protein WAL63_07390 [Solirubrobacteraceae bacterium]